jgi:MarR family transcriptional regulator for hemolysin
MAISADDCAREIIEVVPQIMRVLRLEIRRHRDPDLSVPQFRALAFLSHNAGTSLSEVAEHVGLTLPSMSKLIDGLVGRHLVTRQISPTDRRCVTLALTETGQAALLAARQATQVYLSELLVGLPEAERATIIQAMQTLRPIFTPGQNK